MRMSSAALNRRLVDRCIEVHQLDHAQVVEGTDQREQHGNDGQPHVASSNDGLQNRELGKEADEERNASHREHQHQHDAGKPGAALV